jgi:uncharacterized protein involved in response to NO
MIFGFFYTMIVGFILTASAHWTGANEASGASLTLLGTLWVIEKISIFLNSPLLILSSSSLFVAVFLILLKKQLGREKIAFLVLLSLFSALKIFLLLNYFYKFTENSIKIYSLATFFIIILVTVITSKVIPAFTKNTFNLEEKPTAPKLVNGLTLVLTLLLVIPVFNETYSLLNSFVYFACFILHTIRLSFWHPLLAMKKSTIGLLHLANMFFVLSLLYKAISFQLPYLDLFRASFHFTFMGGVTLIGANIMMRAGLGHTGREVLFGKFEKAVLGCFLLGTIIRVFMPLISMETFNLALHCGMGFWTLGFLLYLLKYFRFFLRK